MTECLHQAFSILCTGCEPLNFIHLVFLSFFFSFLFLWSLFFYFNSLILPMYLYVIVLWMLWYDLHIYCTSPSISVSSPTHAAFRNVWFSSFLTPPPPLLLWTNWVWLPFVCDLSLLIQTCKKYKHQAQACYFTQQEQLATTTALITSHCSSVPPWGKKVLSLVVIPAGGGTDGAHRAWTCIGLWHWACLALWHWACLAPSCLHSMPKRTVSHKDSVSLKDSVSTVPQGKA